MRSGDAGERRRAGAAVEEVAAAIARGAAGEHLVGAGARPARGRANLRVATHTLTERVIVRDGRALGVQVLRGGQRLNLRARREVVLSGGTYGSPQLLMLSGIGDGEQLQALGIPVVQHLPGVGRNLQDHPSVVVEYAAAPEVVARMEAGE